jgi:23S rRNA (uracil1939-C5)-methyltransferase
LARSSADLAQEFVIHALGPQGDGIHEGVDGPIYVAGALPGDSVIASPQRGAGGLARAALSQLVTPSPHRIAAPCIHYDACGGCTLQHATEAFYRSWKVAVVREALAKKNLSPKVWLDPVYVPAHSRSRGTFVAIKANKVVTLGYHRRRSHDVVDVASCLVADPALMDLRGKLALTLKPLLPDRKPVDVFIQIVDGQSDVVLTGPVGPKGRPELSVWEAAAEIANGLKISRMSWRAREHDEPEVLIERAPVMATFGALRVALPPLAFLQPTRLGEDALVAAMMDMLPARGKFADLFSGCGTFSGALLARGTVEAFENDVAAVHALNKAAGGKPLKAIARDLFRSPLMPDDLRRIDAVVFDPPRAGAVDQAKALASSRVPVIIGVSCNPATFARDARALVDGGYCFESVKVIDQFTWSHHVELIAKFVKVA